MFCGFIFPVNAEGSVEYNGEEAGGLAWFEKVIVLFEGLVVEFWEEGFGVMWGETGEFGERGFNLV